MLGKFYFAMIMKQGSFETYARKKKIKNVKHLVFYFHFYNQT